MAIRIFNPVLLLVLVLVLSVCYAKDNCAAYGTMLFTSPTIPGANHKACFTACAENSQCYHYTYNGNCTLTLLSTQLNPALDEFSVGFMICPNVPTRCVAYTGLNSFDGEFSSTHQECFDKCAQNSTCVFYLYNDGTCNNVLLAGDMVDTNSEMHADAFIRCKMQRTCKKG